MALTRKFLKALNLTDEQIESIVDAHSETVEALKGERDQAKANAANIADLQKQLDDANAKLKNAGDAAKVQADFDAFKKQVENERTNAGKTAAVKAALKNAGVQRDEFIDLLMPKVDLEKIVLNDGKLSDTAFVDTLKAQFAGCFGTKKDNGLPPNNPPSDNGGKPDYSQMSDEEYYKATYEANKNK